jgi:hypothetical protein
MANSSSPPAPAAVQGGFAAVCGDARLEIGRGCFVRILDSRAGENRMTAGAGHQAVFC